MPTEPENAWTRSDAIFQTAANIAQGGNYVVLGELKLL